MAEVDLLSTTGEASGRKVELPDAIFARPIDRDAVYQSVVAHQQNQTHGARPARTRAEVAGGGRKPWRQKGTGRARQGSTSAPHRTGGGAVFGPRGGLKRRKLPKRTRRAAILSVLSDKCSHGAVSVVEPLQMDEPKTKKVVEFLGDLKLSGRRVLFVLDEARPAFHKSVRNIPGVDVRVAPIVSAYDLLWAEHLVLFDGAVGKMAEVWG
jgi:large subunit ribosomal protein L4